MPEMSLTPNLRMVALSLLFSRAAALGALVIGALSLAGWSCDVPGLRSILAAQLPMNPVAATCFVLSGASLLFLDLGKAKVSSLRLAHIFMLLVIVVCVSRLVALYPAWDLHLDQLLFREKLAVAGPVFLARMATTTALNFALLGAAVFFLNSARHRHWVLAQWLSLLASVICFQTLVEYAYGLQLVNVSASARPMAFNAALAFVLLCLGILFSHPERTPLMRLLTSNTSGGRTARCLLPLAVMLPFLTGWLWARGEFLGLYCHDFENVGCSLSNMVLFTSLAAWHAVNIIPREEEKLPEVWQRLEVRVRGRAAQLSTAVQRLEEETAGRGRAEERLRLQAAALQAAANTIVITDSNGTVVWVNAAFTRSTGYTFREAVGQNQRFLRSGRHSDSFYQKMYEVILGGEIWQGEITNRRKDGTLYTEEMTITPVKDERGEITHFVAIKQDISERKRALEALRESEEFNRQIINSAHEGIVVYDRNLGYRLWNPFMEQLTGLSAQQVLGRKPTELFPFLEEHGALDLIQRALAGETIVGPDMQFRVPATGCSGWASSQYAPLRDARNEIIGALVVVRDIYQRKQAEEEVRRSAARFRELIENAVYGVYQTTVGGRFIEVNPALVAMLGYHSAQELLGLDLATQVYANPADRALWIERMRREGYIEGAEVQWKRKDGSLILVRLSGRALRDPSGQLEGFEIIVENVTERRALEKQIATLQKFEAIGQLAGGVAHDFNNVIGVIMGWAEIGLGQAPAGSPLRASLQKISDQAQRAAGLTRQLLAFARKQILEPRNINLNKSVSDVLGLLAKAIGESIEIKTVLCPELLLTHADPVQVEQIIMNLCLNARDAMPSGGQLLIETQNAHLSEEYCRTRPYTQPGDYAQLVVTDTGIGMDEATLEHIFEPFFTTKEQGKGTGLGLAMVYGIVKQHNGFIQVRSEPRRGSVFHVYLRAADGVAEPAKELAPAFVKGGMETILVAEDNHAMAELVREILEQGGYRILLVENGEESVEVFRKCRDSIDLVLLDVIMPKLNGPEAYARISALKPGVPVIFATGYTSQVDELHSLTEQGAVILQKPYAASTLKQKVRETLDGIAGKKTPEA